jgi:RPA family protein
MKKIQYSVMALAIAAMTFTACEDVPAPYDTPNGGGGSGTGSLPYASANLNTGWSLVEITAGAQPWSKGSSYAQATGYQTWDGASQKSNKAVEGWLVSPAISTVGYENVKLSFNHTIKYTNNVTGWEANHKVYASTDFNGSTATWKELSFTPVASPYSDWTLYSSGEIQLPAEFVGKETVYIGFWFKAPANASTTWELQSFKMEEGIAEDTPAPVPTPTEDLGTAEAPLTVAKALETINGYADGKESSTDAYVKGIIVSVDNYNSQYKSITYYISDDGTENGKLQVYSGKGLNGADFAAKTDLNKGAIVVVKGKLKKYVKNETVTPEINQSSQIISIENNGGGGGTPQPSGDEGSIDAPKTVAEGLTAINAMEDGATTEINYYIKGKVARIATKAEDIGPNSSSGKNYKDINYYISEDGSENNTIYVYRGKNLNNTDFTSADQLKVGDEVIVYGKLQKFKNNSTGAIVPEMASGNYLVKTDNTADSGEQGGGQGGEQGGGSEASSLTNGDFETWAADNQPTGWKSASSASSATLAKSTDAHGGNYSCNVNGKESSNVRLASQEIKLAAGTYVYTFYAKATTADVAQVRPGYAIVVDGAINSNGGYKYGDYVSINNSEWIKVTQEFTLDAETTVCLLVMNPKKSNYSSGKDALVDDATLTKK